MASDFEDDVLGTWMPFAGGKPLTSTMTFWVVVDGVLLKLLPKVQPSGSPKSCPGAQALVPRCYHWIKLNYNNNSLIHRQIKYVKLSIESQTRRTDLLLFASQNKNSLEKQRSPNTRHPPSHHHEPLLSSRRMLLLQLLDASDE